MPTSKLLMVGASIRSRVRGVRRAPRGAKRSGPPLFWVRATALVLGLAAAACGGDGGVRTMRVQRPTASVAPVPTPEPTYVHALNGRTYTGDPAWRGRPVLAVKVENLPVSRPQSGLDRADVVYEELAEGGITRFIALFQSGDADALGPVRSARTVDPQVIAPLQALFAYAGGVPPVVAAVRNARGLTDVGFDAVPDAYYRRPDRKAPHNLYTSTRQLWRGRHGAPPSEELFSFLAPGQPVQPGAGGSSATFSFSPRSEETRYRYDQPSGLYGRFHGVAKHVLEDGSPVAPANVLFQFVPVVSGATVDVNGERSPEPRVIGSGEAILLTGGQSFRGRWTKSSLDAHTMFVDADGNAMRLQPGQTWVELVPNGRDVRVS